MTDTTKPYHWGRPNPDYAGPTRADSGSSASGGVSAAKGDFTAPASEEPVLVALFETSPTSPDDADWDTDDPYAYADWAEQETEFARESVQEVVDEWAHGDHATDTVVVYGENMGWTRAEGHKVVSFDELRDDPVGVIAPRTSELTQKWELGQDGTMVAYQGHHDSPMMGERYTFRFMTDEESEAYEYGEWDPEDHRNGG